MNEYCVNDENVIEYNGCSLVITIYSYDLVVLLTVS